MSAKWIDRQGEMSVAFYLPTAYQSLEKIKEVHVRGFSDALKTSASKTWIGMAWMTFQTLMHLHLKDYARDMAKEWKECALQMKILEIAMVKLDDLDPCDHDSVNELFWKSANEARIIFECGHPGPGSDSGRASAIVDIAPAMEMQA